ncbi:hypothetical protein [Paludisphaera sp.]|uniref:hypothetical protein n=1 Tax=Paludisphaera sp. TaxID=2017432 RepID=UPI00301DBC86
MGMFLVHALLIALILPLASLLGGPEGAPSRSRSDYRGPAAVALALAAVFFGLILVHPHDSPDAWAFRAFYGVLCGLTVAAANLFVCLEHSHA